MQVSSQALYHKLPIAEGTLEVKQGEVYQAAIKERLTETEAILHIRGKEVHAAFDDGVPDKDHVMIMVTGQKEQLLKAKTILAGEAKTETQPSSADKVLQSLGLSGKEHASLKQAVSMLLDKGSQLTKAAVYELKAFIENAKGTPQSKLETVNALANKKLDVTFRHLRAIHEAMHGKPLNEVLSAIAKEIDPDFQIEKQELPANGKQQSSVQQKGNPDSAHMPKLQQTDVNEGNGTLKGNKLSPESQSEPKTPASQQGEAARQPAKGQADTQQANKPQSIEAGERPANLEGNKPSGDLKSEPKTPVSQQADVARLSAKGEANSLQVNKPQSIEAGERLANLEGNKPSGDLKSEPKAPASQQADVARLSAKGEANSLQANKPQSAGVSQPSIILEGNKVFARLTSESKPVSSGLSEAIRTSLHLIEKEPDLQKVLQQISKELLNSLKNIPELARKAEQAVRDADKLQSIGKERLMQAVKTAELQLPKAEQNAVKINMPVNAPAAPNKHHGQTDQGKEMARSGDVPRAAEKVQVPASMPQNGKHETANGPNQALQKLSQEHELHKIVKQVREYMQALPENDKALQKLEALLNNSKHISQEIMKPIAHAAKQALQLEQAGRDRLFNALQQVATAVKQSEAKLINQDGNLRPNITDRPEAIKSEQQRSEITAQAKAIDNKPLETIRQVISKFQQEPNLKQAIDQIRSSLANDPHIDAKTLEKTDKVLEHAAQLLDKGREITARQHIAKMLTDIEANLPAPQLDIGQSQKSGQQSIQHDWQEQLSPMPPQAKDLLVTRITQKLAEAAHDFRELKREISRNLDHASRLIDIFKHNAYPQAKQMLENAISKLDNAILKSDMMLFTDMQTEKQLMHASTQLADAKKLLARGEHAQAAKIVNNVKAVIDKMIFKPSEQKIIHFAARESMALENRPPAQQLLSHYSETARGGLGYQEPSARQMFEMIRSLGLNHDSDAAHELVFNKDDHPRQGQHQEQNLKAVLLKLAQGEGHEGNTKIVQQAELALTNLTGQQLLSKPDGSGTLQSMFFNLPLLLGGKPENLQVFVNSKSTGQQVDWENCSLYFLLETKKLGDVGIMVNAAERNLSITIKNDLPGFKARMEPLAGMAKAKLEEIGYNVNTISFTRMNPIVNESHLQQESEAKPSRPVFTKKGMDFKI